MANADARHGQIELHVREVEGGRFTQHCLPNLQLGDALQLELPLGVFYWHERDWRPMVMVATRHRHCAYQSHFGVLAGQG